MWECIREEIKEAFFAYLEVYLHKRDLEGVSHFFSPEFSGVGTGFHEMGFTKKEMIDLYRQDITDVSESISYEIHYLHVQPLSETVGVVVCVLDMRVVILQEYVKLNNFRLSMVWRKENGHWYCDHMHISLPTSVHGDTEAFPVKEIEDRNKVLERLVDERTEALVKANQELSNLVVTDSLTQLANRRHLEEVIVTELKRSERYTRPFSLVLLDIDHFKEVNDTFGHLVGDKVLQEFARILLETKRNTDLCGRWGGEEFLVFCPETEMQGGWVLAERLRQCVEGHPFPLVGYKTASFGVASYRVGDTYETLLARVDRALYRAKERGRNHVCTEKEEFTSL
ncbi:MAG: diguanylate cyclase [Brevinematales bacterium]|nr:diguanylate cyclase [Brevinematales bacterium]